VSAANPTDTTLDTDVAAAREPVERLAADGSQVAYTTGQWCEILDRSSAVVTRLSGCSRGTDSIVRTFGPAFAGGALAWSSESSFMGGDCWVAATATVDVPAFKPISFPGVGTLLRSVPLTALVGRGDLLVFSTWGPCPIFYTPTSACAHAPKTKGTLWRLDGTNAVQITSSGGALTPLAVDAARILVDHEDGTLALMRPDGTTSLSISVDTNDFVDAALQGADVVVLNNDSIADYDAEDGTRLHNWPLPSGTRQLAGVANGVAAYVSGTDIHLVRLADGKDTTISAEAGPVFAALDAAGLYYSYTVADKRYPGRVAFVPSTGLPLR